MQAPRWSVHQLELGRSAYELVTLSGARVRFELYDGGGFCTSLGVWRVQGRVWGVVEAGSG